MPNACSKINSAYVGRFAPAPTGALHLGNARTFLLAWLRARSVSGSILLRLEDLDHPKVKRDAAAQAYEDLRWLGLDWDAGADSDASYIQSNRLEIYRRYFNEFRERGLIYPCTCTRQDIQNAQSAPHPGEEMKYPNTCRGKYQSAEEAEAATGRAPAWRFLLPDEDFSFTDVFCGVQSNKPAEWSGDFVVAKGENLPSYQLAVVVDDALMGVTEVVRGDDLLLSTHRQLALYAALGFSPPDFLHVPLVVGSDGKRLAKRHGDTRISTLRERGVEAVTVVGWLAATCGLAEFYEKLTPLNLLPRFALSKILLARAVVDDPAKKLLGIA